MLPLKRVTKARALQYPFLIINKTLMFTVSSTSPSSSTTHMFFSSAAPTAYSAGNLQAKDVVLSFKEWFKSRNNLLIDRIFEILSSHDDEETSLPRSSDLALSQLGFRLTEAFVLEVLNYGKDVLLCLKFFDWAGRQKGFYHTLATFHAIFKILKRAKLMLVMLDFLENCNKQRYVQKVGFFDILVMGYAVAGKLYIALQLYGKMRFQGLDLDGFAYHVLLNASVEESCFDVVEVIAKQITMRGFESEVTHSIMVKSLCKQKQLDEAVEFIRGLVSNGQVVSGHVVGPLVDALCKSGKFERAGELVEEFRELGMVAVEYAYGIWIRELVRAGKLDGAWEFLQRKKLLEGYVPDVFRYNVLICRLLRENRLDEVFDLLVEMREGHISPDMVTMNAALCFFCKAGMVDVALELYNSKAEFGLSPNSMAYNYLINTLCGDGSVDESYRVLKNSIELGYFPGKKCYSFLADALCREGKLDKMREVAVAALEQNFMPSDSTFDKFITALCRARRVEDGYILHGELNRINGVTTKNMYYNLIHGFNKTNRGDIAARLLIEMQEKGHAPGRTLFRGVICCLCDMDNPEKQFLKLLEMQLSHHEPRCQIYNFFIDGAGHARKPELAREVFEMMGRSGIAPNLHSCILMLQSYLNSERISDALNFFNDLRKGRVIGRKLCNTVVVGLCKANRPDIALDFMREMRENGVVPSLECYEELVRWMCLNEKYDSVVHLIDDLEKGGRHISSFIGNTLLFHSLKTQKLYEAWVRSRDVHDETSCSSILRLLMGEFSGQIKVNLHIEDLEEVIEQCFPLNIFTCNVLLRRLCKNEMDLACDFFYRICQKGYEPNQWTYDILVHGLFKHKRTAEAKIWLEEMFRKGIEPTERIKLFI